MALVQEIPTTEKRAAVTIYNIAVGLNNDGERLTLLASDGAPIADFVYGNSGLWPGDTVDGHRGQGTNGRWQSA